MKIAKSEVKELGTRSENPGCDILDKLLVLTENDDRFDGWKQDDKVESFFGNMGRDVPADYNDLS